MEEIEIHDLRDAQEQIRVEGRTAEHLVEVVARAGYFARQPAHAAPVFPQLLVDDIANVYVAFCVSHAALWFGFRPCALA